jgi:hypothetical protein
MAKRRARNREQRSQIGGGSMSAFSQNLKFAIGINTTDDTKRGVSSAMKSIMSIASKPIILPFKFGLGAAAMLRDFNLGIRPLLDATARAMDTTITRGGRVAQIQEQFQKATRLSEAASWGLANSLQVAADGELRRVDAMALGNQLMAAGVTSAKDISTIYEFAARRADAFGESGKGAIEQIVGSMRRGSFRALKEFGIDIGDVADQFEQMQAGGKFTALEFAARKAEVIKTTIGKMREGIDGFGTGFAHTLDYWDMAKSRAGDMVDSLLLGIERSETMREAVKGLSDGLGGISEHFRAGGSIADILVGKQGGKSGGIFGLMKAGASDVGSYFGRSLAAGGLRGMADMLEEMPAFGDTLWAGGSEFIKELRKTFDKYIAKLQALFPAYMQKSFPATMGQIDKAHDASVAGDWLKYFTHTTAAAGKFGAESLFKLGYPGAGRFVDTATNMIPLGGLFDDGGPLGWFGKLAGQLGGSNHKIATPPMDWRLQMLALFGTAPIGQMTPGFPDTGPVSRFANRHGLPKHIARMRAKADALQQGGIFAPGGSDFMREWGLFQGDLPKPPAGVEELPDAPGGLRLTEWGERQRERQLVLLGRDQKKLASTISGETRTWAAKRAGELRRRGYQFSYEDQQALENEEWDRRFGERSAGLNERRGAIQAELGASRARADYENERDFGPATKAIADDTKRSADLHQKVLDVLTATMNELVSLKGKRSGTGARAA